MAQSLHRKASHRGQAGFSLLEMLVALAILSAAAYVALDTVESDTGQTRYQITENRLKKIRRAIVGNPDLVLNGSPVVSGYVADVGRLPECLEQLVARVECGGYTPPVYSQVSGGLFSGWRGPYLTHGTNGIADGWGSTGGVNFGWAFDVDNGSLGVKSKGRDRENQWDPAVGSINGYDSDQYMDGKVFDNPDPAVTPEYAIVANDYQVNLNQSAFHVEVNANRINDLPTPTTPMDAPNPELAKNYCVALLDVDPADVTKWRLIPSDADRDGSVDDPTTVTILLDAPATTGPETLVFSANKITTQGNRPLVLYEATGADCLATGEEAQLNDLTTTPGTPINPIVARFGLVLSARTPHAATFRTTFDFEE